MDIGVEKGMNPACSYYFHKVEWKGRRKGKGNGKDGKKNGEGVEWRRKPKLNKAKTELSQILPVLMAVLYFPQSSGSGVEEGVVV